MFFLKIPTKRQPELSKLAGLLILLHSLYGTNLLLVSGHDFSRAAPGQKVRASAPAIVKSAQISNGKSAGAKVSA
jgi:hypothetical protein